MADLTILGAGIFGLSIAWECSKSGAKVQVIDPNGVGAGASGGLLGALAPHVPENWNPKKAFQLDSLLAAEGFWAEVEQAAGQPSSYGRTGRLQPLADAAAVSLARTREASARELWQGRAEWSVITELPDPAWAPPSPTGHWVHASLTARITTRAGLGALATAMENRGVMIAREGTPAGAIIHATGTAGLEDLNAATGQIIGQGIKGQAALLAANLPPGAPQIFADTLHIVPHADGNVAIGSTTERVFDAAHTTDAQLDALTLKARALVPALADAPVLERWAGLRPRAKSRAPLLGHHPTRAGHFVANGGFKIGIGMAPGVARLMARLVLDGQNIIPPAFDISTQIDG